MTKPIIGLAPRTKKDGSYSVNDRYIEYVRKIGGRPLIFHPLLEKVKTYVEISDGILLPGFGRDVHPYFYNEHVLFEHKFMDDLLVEFEINLIKEVKNQKKPLLAICYGCQILNVAFNGTLYQSIPHQIGEVVTHQKKTDAMHNIKVKENTLLHEILEEKNCVVNSNHHQGLNELGEGLKACAFSEDGLCEAIQHVESDFILGVQWHPERLNKESSSKLSKAFIQACKKC